MTPIEKAVNTAGGQTALAGICGVKQQQVWNWINRQGHPPARYCYPIEAATGVPAVELRPDVFQTAPAVASEAVA
jgi:DNA-binding transcriptional regulator YdaS (Cro superfamily)